MSRFQTLMRREWMQHHRAWLLIMLLPPVLTLLLLGFVTSHVLDRKSVV